jgi:hypothetical protein
MPLAAVNGLGLALVIPCAQSLIADLNPPDQRGRSFGMMQLTSSLGAVAASISATNLGAAATTLMGLEGWRAAFLLVAAVSVATGYLVRVGACDPRFRGPRGSGFGGSQVAGTGEGGVWQLEMGRLGGGAGGGARVQQRSRRGPAEAADSSGGSSSREGSLDSSPTATLLGPGGAAGSAAAGAKPWGSGPLAGVLWMLRVRTFQAIVLQGIVGSIPWQAMSFSTLWLQLVGFSALQASTLLGCSALGTAAGGLIGGSLGDWAAQRRPLSGRIAVAQVSVAAGIPLMIVLLVLLPGSPALHLCWPAYAATMLVTGAAISWTWAGCNSPIFSEIVPPELLSSVYAYDRSLENSLAACATPVVGLVAERVFGFTVARADASLQGGGGAAPPGGGADVFGSSAAARAANARALASSMLGIMLVCWTLCLLFYGVLYFTYPKDRIKQRAALGGAGGSRAGSGGLVGLASFGSGDLKSAAGALVVGVSAQ